MVRREDISKNPLKTTCPVKLCYSLTLVSEEKPRCLNNYLSKVKKVQLVKSLAREKTYPDGLEIRALIPWLAVGPELSK